jgi:hypothetical protein
MRTKVIIFLVLLIIVLVGIELFAFIRKEQPHLSEQSVKNPKCQQSHPKSGGQCRSIVYTVIYNSATNACESVSGGCSIDSVFDSIIQCEQTCVDGWIPQDPLDVILLKGEIKHKDEYIPFDLGKQQALYQTSDSKGGSYRPKSAFTLQSGNIVAIIEPYEYSGIGNNQIAKYPGAYLAVFTSAPDGKYRADKLTYLTDSETFLGIWDRHDIQWSEENSLITIQWPQRGNCGPKTVPCGSKFKKEFRLENNELFPI